MELIDKPAGYIIIIGGDSWCRVPDEDVDAGRKGMYLNCELMEVHHAEDMFNPIHGSKYLGRVMPRRRPKKKKGDKWKATKERQYIVISYIWEQEY